MIHRTTHTQLFALTQDDYGAASRLIVSILLGRAALALILVVLTVLQHLDENVDVRLDGGGDDGALHMISTAKRTLMHNHIPVWSRRST